MMTPHADGAKPRGRSVLHHPLRRRQLTHDAALAAASPSPIRREKTIPILAEMPSKGAGSGPSARRFCTPWAQAGWSMQSDRGTAAPSWGGGGGRSEIRTSRTRRSPLGRLGTGIASGSAERTIAPRSRPSQLLGSAHPVLQHRESVTSSRPLRGGCCPFVTI